MHISTTAHSQEVTMDQEQHDREVATLIKQATEHIKNAHVDINAAWRLIFRMDYSANDNARRQLHTMLQRK